MELTTNHWLTREQRQMEVWCVRCNLSAPWVTSESNFLTKVFSLQLDKQTPSIWMSTAVFVIKALWVINQECVDQHGVLRVLWPCLSWIHLSSFSWRWVVFVNYAGRNTSAEFDGSEAQRGQQSLIEYVITTRNGCRLKLKYSST